MSIGLAVALFGLTALALAMLLAPLFWRRRSPAAREAYNLAVYRDQLGEAARDVARGLLNAEQAEAARTEIGRRILALSPAPVAQGSAATAAPSSSSGRPLRRRSRARRRPELPPIVADELLDLHQLLRDHRGSLTDLLRPAGGQAPRR